MCLAEKLFQSSFPEMNQETVQLENSSMAVEKLTAFSDGAGRFLRYADGFQNKENHSFSMPVRQKIEHTGRVCHFACFLGKTAGLFSPLERRLFLLSALFHDISRFEQYMLYGTFRDNLSFDHGDRSVEIMQKGLFLQETAPEYLKILMEAVRVHNKISIPEYFPEEALTAARMLRDADKLAVLEEALAFFEHPDKNVKLDVPDPDTFTQSIAERVLHSEKIHNAELRCVNDFKINLFAWAGDLNCGTSCRYLFKRRYYERLRKLMPDSSLLDELLTPTLAELQSTSLMGPGLF